MSVNKFIVVFLFSFFLGIGYAQRANNRSKSELGFFGGAAYYIGDLNPTGHFQNTNPYAGIIYRYNVHSRMALRTTIAYGNLNASDSDSKSNFQKNRNLSFQTDFYEFAAGFEFNYAAYQTGHERHWISPYLYAELGVFRMNPKTNFNNELIELQSLGTEGQGTNLSKKDVYSRTQFCLPIGLGLKMSVSKNISFAIEYAFRKTFTDYLDDVSSNRYVDRDVLAENNGPLVSELSNRSLDQSTFGKRGDSSTKDWYFVCNASLTIRLGKPDKCFNH